MLRQYYHGSVQVQMKITSIADHHNRLLVLGKDHSPDGPPGCAKSICGIRVFDTTVGWPWQWQSQPCATRYHHIPEQHHQIICAEYRA